MTVAIRNETWQIKIQDYLANNTGTYFDYKSEFFEALKERKPVSKDIIQAWNSYPYKNPCPACLERKDIRATRNTGILSTIHICQRCGAIFGSVLQSVSERWVKNEWDDTEPDRATWKYFDFTICDRNGKEIARRHGWYNRANKKIVQSG